MTGEESKVHQLIQERFRRVLIHEYMAKAVDRAGFGGLSILRTPLGTRITIKTERPGIVIGRKGRDIQRLTDEVERLFDLENPQIEAVEVKNVHLNPQIMASKLVFALERGWNFRRAGNAMLQRVMESGARGCQITLTGKLTGRRHRSEKFIAGHIKHCGETALQFMKTGFAVARRKEGVIGCKVAIMPPNARLPDEVTIRDLEAEAEAAAKAEEHARRQAEERALKEEAARAAAAAKAEREAKAKAAREKKEAMAKARQERKAKAESEKVESPEAPTPTDTGTAPTPKPEPKVKEEKPAPAKEPVDKPKPKLAKPVETKAPVGPKARSKDTTKPKPKQAGKAPAKPKVMEPEPEKSSDTEPKPAQHKLTAKPKAKPDGSATTGSKSESGGDE